MKSQKGFSLIELMVVVVIIGILATAGVPQYQKFQMKAKRSEAKSLLSGMYTAQKAFLAEWGRYFADFRAVGYGVDGAAGYVVGFTAAGNAAPVNHPTFGGATPTAATQFDSDAYCSVAANGCNNANANAAATDIANPSVTAYTAASGVATFSFAAVANLDNDAVNDVMYIDQTRQFTQPIATDDIAN